MKIIKNQNKNIFFRSLKRHFSMVSNPQDLNKMPFSDSEEAAGRPSARGKIYFCFGFFLVVFFLLFVPAVQAQVIGNFDFLNGIVPCGLGPTTIIQDGKAIPNPSFVPCTVCHFYKLIQNIINFLLLISSSLVTLMAVYIGFLFLFSGGNPKMITDAKSKLWLLVWGLVWVLGSWLVLNTIITVFANPALFPTPWNRISCEISQSSVSTPTSSLSPTPSPTPTLPGTPLREQEARNQLQQAGIAVNKNPCPTGVSYQSVPGGCTSLEGLRASSIEGAKQLKEDCDCTVIVTGGTEKGHSTVGTATHGSGYKLDFARNNTLDSYITNNYTYIGIRSGDGAKLYKSPSGAVFAKESDHWDTKGWDAEF